MRLAPPRTLAVYKGKAFVRFARKARMTDADLGQAAQRANDGLVDADLGGGVIKAAYCPGRRGEVWRLTVNHPV